MTLLTPESYERVDNKMAGQQFLPIKRLFLGRLSTIAVQQLSKPRQIAAQQHLQPSLREFNHFQT